MNTNAYGLRLAGALVMVSLAGCEAPAPEFAEPSEPQATVAVEDEPESIDTTEVIVFGSRAEVTDWLKSENWWGEENRDEQLTVPYAMLAGISPAWQQAARNMPVAEKKEIFYRFILPLVMHANAMVTDRRARLARMGARLTAGESLPADELEWLSEVATLLRISDPEIASEDDAKRAVQDALYRLDVIPAGLVLGQAAYESGYGTSRFAVEGNALFGQWTYGGKGLVPEQQRKNLGDHRIAAFDWPFDSVRGYFLNLSSHPAYADFRRLRAELRAAGKPLTSLALADGLIRYSERGQKYVDTLKGIIRVNELDIADDAVFRDEPMRFVVGADSPDAADALRAEIEALRESGELADIVARMRLE
jgi:uncharacterized FlgJ-related protein